MSENSLSNRVYNIIKTRIKMLEYQPGSIFIKERELSDDLQISRTPIREATKRLVQENWLIQGDGNHLYVREVTAKDVREIMEIRSIISYFAIDAITRKNLSRFVAGKLDAQLTEMKNCENALDFANAENKFHNLLLERMNNIHMLNFWANTHDEVFRMAFFVLRKKEYWPDVIKEHERFVDALWSKDNQQMKEAMKLHFISSYHSIITEAIGGQIEDTTDDLSFLSIFNPNRL